ncbi:DNA adenine methylase [Psittacicella hinzii]|nr:DNA adenine methylase [Psittacicella hinzii]
MQTEDKTDLKNIQAKLFTEVNIAKYDQDIDFLLKVPAKVEVPEGFIPEPLLNETTATTQEQKTPVYDFLPLFDFADEEQQGNNEQVVKNYIPSPLNYAGGKYSIVDQIIRLFPENINFFYDVFSGAANIGVNVNAKVITCVDNNPYITQLLQYLQTQTYEELSLKLDYLISEYGLSNSAAHGYSAYDSNSDDGLAEYNKEPYKHLRSDFNHLLRQLRVRTHLYGQAHTSKREVNIVSAAVPSQDNLVFDEPILIRLLLLLIYGFNNIVRFNNLGDYNQPVGKRDYSIKLREKFKAFLPKIKELPITFVDNDYLQMDIAQLVQENAFLYLDPPYTLSPVVYGDNPVWNDTDEQNLFNFLVLCDQNKIRFAYSTVLQFKGTYNYKLLDWCIAHKFNINFIQPETRYSAELGRRPDRTVEVVITNYVK